MDLNNLILFFVLVVFGIFFYKYFSLVLKKYYPRLLIDDQLAKPQAFHESPISITGGTGIFFSLGHFPFCLLTQTGSFFSILICRQTKEFLRLF